MKKSEIIEIYKNAGGNLDWIFFDYGPLSGGYGFAVALDFDNEETKGLKELKDAVEKAGGFYYEADDAGCFDIPVELDK